MNTFLIDFPTEAKFQEFCKDWKRIGITVKNYDPKYWVAVVQYKETNELAVGAMVRVLEDFGEVLRCQ